MKRIKLITDDEFNGKEAFMRWPNPMRIFFINGKEVLLRDAKWSIQDKQPDAPDVVLINFNELPETFNMQVLVERVKQDMYDCKKRPCENNIERRFRELRQQGKLNYRVVDASKRIYTKEATAVIRKRVVYYQSTKTR